MPAIITQNINKTAKEMENLITKSKRKLFELEIALNIAEIKNGKFDIFEKAEELIQKIK